MNATIQLDRDSAKRVIDHAISTHAQVVLNVPDRAEVTINGFLISGDGATMLMEVTGKPAIVPASLCGKTVSGDLFCEQQYSFTTTLREAPTWGDSQALAMDRPCEISVHERRRFWRARLAPSARVSLEWVHCGSVEQHDAALLNVSADGLACRVEDVAGTAIELHDEIIARFAIEGHPTTFDLAGVLMNKVPASQGGVILGVQFSRVLDSARQLSELRRLLNRPAAQIAGARQEALA